MKLLVCGSRTIHEKELVFDLLRRFKTIDTIIHGGCVGVDLLAGEYAKENGIPTQVFQPDWSKGKIAAFERNSKMVEVADKFLAICTLKQSKGTEMTIRLMRDAGKGGLVLFI